MTALQAVAERALAAGVIPDAVIRAAIRFNCRTRLAAERRPTVEAEQEALRRFLAESRHAAIAPVPEKANEQHYEVPPAFFDAVLGPRLKYSCCYWPAGVETLAQAEEMMLELTCSRAQLEDGMDVLDLGCGWGSLSLWIAEKYPRCRVTGVSNSAPQREHILRRAAERGLTNVDVITADANVLELSDERFDRVLSIEMLEHVRNHEALLARVSSWLRPDGRLFVHVFTHRQHAYPYTDSWMARQFFSGGIMPSHDLLLHYQRDLVLLDRWAVDGTHYERTANAWLDLLDANKGVALAALAQTEGPDGGPIGEGEARRRLALWRVFFMACAELWGYRQGREWLVSHYLFAPR
jgi:cyclopropane-fatty-acyl-phospholipid synthase